MSPAEGKVILSERKCVRCCGSRLGWRKRGRWALGSLCCALRSNSRPSPDRNRYGVVDLDANVFFLLLLPPLGSFFLPCQTCATVQYIVAVDQCLAQGNRVPSPPPSTPDSFSLSSSLSRINNNRRRRERKKVKEKTNLEHSQYITPVHLPVAQ